MHMKDLKVYIIKFILIQKLSSYLSKLPQTIVYNPSGYYEFNKIK